MENKLISMTKFTLDQSKKINDPEILARTLVSYATFLELILQIWMFVPAKLINGEWVVLEEPKTENDHHGSFSKMQTDFQKEKEFLEAQERVLFHGFEFAKQHGSKLNNTVNYEFIFHAFWYCTVSNKWNLSIGLSDVESILKYNLPLTESAKKQLGL